MTVLYRLLPLVAAVFLSACTPNTTLRALIDAGEGWVGPRTVAPTPQLDPRFSYLRIVRGDRVVFFALGYTDPHPSGPVEVWYSASGEVLRLQGGRVVGSSGGQYQWLYTSFAGLPAWSPQPSALPQHFVRVRDLQPGYRWGLREQMALQPIAAPTRHQLQGVAASELAWFEERTLTRHAQALPPSRYALRFTPQGPVVLYAQTCLGPELCFSWQRWTGLGSPLLP